MVPPALDRPPSSEPVAAACEWNPANQIHTPWCTVKERYEGCIRQGAHGAEEHPCPGLRTNLQYRRNGVRNTGPFWDSSSYDKRQTYMKILENL